VSTIRPFNNLYQNNINIRSNGIYAHYIPKTVLDIHVYMPNTDISNGS